MRDIFEAKEKKENVFYELVNQTVNQSCLEYIYRN